MQSIIDTKYVNKKRHLSLNEVMQVPYNLDLAACWVRKSPSSVETHILLSKIIILLENIYASKHPW